MIAAQGIPTQRAETLAAPFMGSPVAESHAPETALYLKGLGRG